MAIPYGGKQLADAFRTVRGNTVQIAEEIPDDKYGFVPAPGTRSVEKLLTHVALATGVWEDIHKIRRLKTLVGYDFFGLRERIAAEESKSRSKAEILGMLRTDGEKFAVWLESLSQEDLAEMVVEPDGKASKSRFERLLGAKEHEMHHRGQLMLIERQIGIVPHLTRRFEELTRKMRAGA